MAAISIVEKWSAISAPITALHFINKEFLIIGEGSFVKIYNVDKNCCVLNTKLLQTGRIQKFKVISRDPSSKSFMILGLGGKSVRFFSVAVFGQDIRFEIISKEKYFDTWIWDATKLTPGVNGNDAVVALITSQNKTIIWNYAADKVLKIHSCQEHCILYSACFWGNTLDNLLFAVGTVFNEVLVWKTVSSTNYEEACSEHVHPVDKRLKGHEGVIFSIRFTSSGEHLLSVSDDRSIRKWDIKSEECLQVLYGHTARVWDATYLNELIVSIGEDATCFVWDDQSTVLKKFKGHKGKNIWSLAVDEESNLIATGGGDSSIRLWTINSTANAPLDSLSLPSSDDSDDFPQDLFVLSSSELLVLTNAGYLLKYIFASGKEESNYWETVFYDKEFARHSSMAVEKYQRLAVFGSLNGRVKIISLDENTVIDKQVFAGKVFSVSVLTRDTACNVQETYVVASGPNGIILLWQLISRDSCVQVLHKGLFELPYCRQRWLAAAALVCPKDHGPQLQIGLIVGDRRGSIHVFDVEDRANEAAQAIGPKQTLLSMHGKNGVTGIYAGQDWVFSTGRDGFYRKYSVNGNGTLDVLERKKVCKGMDWIEGLLFNEGDILVYGFYMQSHFAVWSTNLNEIILKINCGGGYRSWDLLQHGHDQTYFSYLKGPKILLYKKSFTNSQKILKEPLHGREITCLCLIDSIKDGDTTKILFATGSEDTLVNLVIYDAGKNEFEVVHSFDGHIGSVKSVVAVKENSADEMSGGNEFGGQGKVVNREAVSSLNRSYIMFTCGSRSSLKCNRVFYHADGYVSTSLLAEIGTPMNSLKTKPRDLYDDLRFLSMNVIPVKNTEFSYCLAVACSDGYTRIYGFEAANKEFTLLMASDFHGRCVQTLRSFVHAVDSKHRHFLVSGATDGRIALWDITSCIDILSSLETKDEKERGHGTKGGFSSKGGRNTKQTVERYGNFFHIEKLNSSVPRSSCSQQPLYVFQAHQSGVHCVDIKACSSDSQITLASGGDDNSIFTSNFTLTKHADHIACTVKWADKNIFAHHSTITGIQLVRPDVLVSCSIDQRLKVWQTNNSGSQILNEDEKEKSCWKNIFTDFVDIPDASDLICLQKQDEIKALVCGIGLQIKTLKMEKT